MEAVKCVQLCYFGCISQSGCKESEDNCSKQNEKVPLGKTL